MLRRLSALALLLCLGLLVSCATTDSVPDLPPTLTNQGLMVARLYVPGSETWDNARINIDGKFYGASLRDGYIAIALEPGEHKFIQLRVEGQQLSSYQSDDNAFRKVRGGGGGGGGYYYVPGGSYTIYFTTLAVDRTFKVEPGKITNLGLIVYLEVPEDPNRKRASVGQSKEFYTVTVDNTAEMTSYLRTNYAPLMGTLKDSTVTLAPSKYLEASKLPDLRRFIASHEVKHGKFVMTSNVTAVYGDAGTIALMRLDPKDEKKPNEKSNEKKPSVEVLDTGTLANIIDARRDKERLLFLASDGKLLVYDNGKLSNLAMPMMIHAVKLGVLENNGLVVVDNRMRVFMSADGGATWNTYEGSMAERPRNDIGFVPDRKGAYFYLGNRGVPSTIYYMRPGETKPVSINGPTQTTGTPTTSRNYLMVRENGLFLVYKERDFYFRPHNGTNWVSRAKPSPTCKPMTLDASGRNLKVECDGLKYESTNSGVSWAKTDA